MSGSRFNDQTLRIFKALKKTNKQAAYAYLDGAYKREEIDRYVREVLGGPTPALTTTKGVAISANYAYQQEAENNNPDSS